MAATAPTKVALVTASSAGLGAAIVHALAPHYRVVVNYFSRPEKAQTVIDGASKIPSLYPCDSHTNSPRFHAIKADAASRSAVTSMVGEVIEKMGRLDVVVSNSGATRLTNFMDFADQTREEDWELCFGANVKAHLWLFEAAKPYLERSEGGGAFLCVASVAGCKPGGSSLAYSVTKAAEIHLVKGLAVIAGKKGTGGIRVNAVSPGLMMTEWGQKFPPAKIEGAKSKAALKDLAEVEDVAEQVRSMVMNKGITGQNVVVDCGGVI